MSTESTPTVRRERDPVCGMSVRVAVAVEERLVTEYEHHTYYFCGAGCRDGFMANPAAFITSHGHAAEAAPAGTPDIDDGMRRWYESCSCCLSDAYPEVKAALDQERAANAQPEAGAGICEVAEAAEAETAISRPR
jgi:YHS domain-containing protein